MAKLFAVSLRPGLMRGFLSSVIAYAISEPQLSTDVKGKLFAIESIITRYTLGGTPTPAGFKLGAVPIPAGQKVFYVWDTQLELLRRYVEEFGGLYSRVDRTYTDLTLEVASALSRVQEQGGLMGFALRSAHPETIRTKWDSWAALEASKNMGGTMQLINQASGRAKDADKAFLVAAEEWVSVCLAACWSWTDEMGAITFEIAVEENARRYLVDQISTAQDAMATNSDPTLMSHFKVCGFANLMRSVRAAEGLTLLYLNQAFAELMQMLPPEAKALDKGIQPRGRPRHN